MTAIRAIAVLPSVKRRLRKHGYHETREWLADRRRILLPDSDPQRLANAAEVAVGALPRPTSCLERSLTVWWLLGGDPDAEICFGVAPGDPRPQFHAWVEYDGKVVNDDPEIDVKYQRFDRSWDPAG